MTGLRLVLRRASLPSLAHASAAALALSSLAACAKKQDRPVRQPPTVSVASVTRATVPYLIEANGVVTPLQTVTVIPQVDGILTDVDFQEGQDVRAGQTLFHIDPRPYAAAYQQALAVLARDSATAGNAKAEADRYRKLVASRVVTPEEGEQFIATAASSDATVRGDIANVATAKFNLDNTVIKSPIDGKTGSLLVRKGNLVRSGAGTPLVVINQVRPILVRFAIPSAQLPLLLQYGGRGGLQVTAVPGGVAPASPSIDSLAASVMNPIQDSAGAGPSGSGRGTRGGAGQSAAAAGSVAQQGGPTGDPVKGTLSFIDNAVDTTTSTVQLKAKFDNSNGALWSGEFATTSLHLFDEDNALVVPVQALVPGQRGTYVYIVDQTDTVRQRAVTVERTAGNVAIISSGVHEGEQVVTDGQSRLTPDAAVRLRTAADTASSGGGRRGRGGKGGKGGKGGGRRGGGGGGGGAAPSGGA